MRRERNIFITDRVTSWRCKMQFIEFHKHFNMKIILLKLKLLLYIYRDHIMMIPFIRFKIFLLGRSRTFYNVQTITLGHLKLYNQVRCAGHAKWQNIKNTKQANDLAKGKLISRYVLQVRRAVVSGNMQTDPKLNSRLGDILTEAARFNVPKATLERAIARAINIKMISINLEIQGPGGCTLIVRCETDNVSFLRRDIKKLIKKFDANLMPDDTLINMFQSQGFVRTETKTVEGRDIDQDFAEEAAIIANAQEVCLETFDESTDGNLSHVWLFKTDSNSLNPCKGELEKQGFKVISSDLDLVPYREVDFGQNVQEKVEELQKVLRETENVVDVYHNVAISKE